MTTNPTKPTSATDLTAQYERKSHRLLKEINTIERIIYGPISNDPKWRAYDLERKREDIVRAAVLSLHTSIEDMLSELIRHSIMKEHAPYGNSARAVAVGQMLSGGGSLGFNMKLTVAVALGALSEITRKKLSEMNILRNKCSHYHTLNQTMRRGKRPAQKKPPLLNFRGHNLYNIKVFEGFLDEYESIWQQLYKRKEQLHLANLTR